MLNNEYPCTSISYSSSVVFSVHLQILLSQDFDSFKLHFSGKCIHTRSKQRDAHAHALGFGTAIKLKAGGRALAQSLFKMPFQELYFALFLISPAIRVLARTKSCTRYLPAGSTDCSTTTGECETLYHRNNTDVPVSQLPYPAPKYVFNYGSLTS